MKFTLLLMALLLLNSCASGYKAINPAGLNYNSKVEDQGVLLEYKYDLLEKKYYKKEKKKDVRLIAVKITNNSDRDLIFGENIGFTYINGNQLVLLEREKAFKELKQKPLTYLLYFLLTPVTLNITTTNTDHNGYPTGNVIPVGLILGPGLGGGNLYHSTRANKKFKAELMEMDLLGKKLAKGETVSGLIAVRADNYDALKIRIGPHDKKGSGDIAQ